MKINKADSTQTAQKMAQVKDLCMARLRGLPREKREAAADAIVALADPQWWEMRQKGSDVFMLLLDMRKAEVMQIMKDAAQ